MTMRALILAICLVAAAPLQSRAAEAQPDSPYRRGVAVLDRWIVEATDTAERAILLGGVVLYRNRHTAAGAVLGCLAGSTVGAGSALGLGLATGGIALPATGPGASLGCALGAAGGAVLGRGLDE